MSNTNESDFPISGAVPEAGHQPVHAEMPVTSSQLPAPADDANITTTSASTNKTVGLHSSTSTALTGMPPSSNDAALSALPVNFLTHPHLPREVRDKIYAYTLPPEIVVKDGKMDTFLGVLFVNRQSRAECLEVIGSSTYEKDLKLEYESITSLVDGLGRLPDSSLARFKNFTIYSTGPYNGHSPRFTCRRGRVPHSCNICPTFLRRGDRCLLKIGYDCQSCAAEYQRELTYRCATITSKVQRLTGVQREHEVPVIVTDKETLAQARAPLAKKNFQHRVILPGLLRNYIKEVRQFYLLLREHHADSLA
jgi:hypothetical protein